MVADRLGIDFGTSNSAVAILRDGAVQRIAVEEGRETLPTAVFFPARGGAMRIGSAASEALIAGDEGRYMRALKSVLGTPLFHESRLVAGKRRTLSEVVTAFLIELRSRAEKACGQPFRRVLSGRPVHFHSNDAERDARAEADLRACYLAAGFDDVDFLPEPEAATLASHGMGQADAPGLIVDIGGGTSDFSVFRRNSTGVEILASHGIRLGGTDFDQHVSLAHAMPALGHGGSLRREMGPGLLPVPNAIYLDLATWAKIPFLYTPEVRRMASDMARVAVEPRQMGRLVTVLEEELGHELAFAVERGKIAANAASGAGTDALIGMGFIERGLALPLSAKALDAALDGCRKALHAAAAETLRMAQVSPQDIGSVILVGGSSLMGLVSQEAMRLCPGAELLRAQAFTAVVDGLAIAAAR